MSHEHGHRSHHFGGFLGLALHKIRSKSTNQLKDEQEERPRPRKRAFSLRDLLSVSSTSFEYIEELPSIDSKFGNSDVTTIAAFVEPELHSKCSRATSSLKSSPDKQSMSAASISASISSPSISSDADVLDQTLLSIRTKLVSTYYIATIAITAMSLMHQCRIMYASLFRETYVQRGTTWKLGLKIFKIIY